MKCTARAFWFHYFPLSQLIIRIVIPIAINALAILSIIAPFLDTFRKRVQEVDNYLKRTIHQRTDQLKPTMAAMKQIIGNAQIELFLINTFL